MSVSRSALQRGIRGPFGMIYWRDSWHEHEHFAFSTSEKLQCDEKCGKPILPGELYSIGVRQIEPDAPVRKHVFMDTNIIIV